MLKKTILIQTPIRMSHKINCFIALLMISSCLLSGQQSQEHLTYIQHYKDIAIREMKRTQIPASIKLAQGILESSAGQSELALNANNHFGIKCGSDWTGEGYYKMDDDFDINGNRVPSCFRSYATVEASFHGHSDFLTNPAKAYRYGPLFELGPSDYEGWAHGLKEAGYATSETYPEKLISLIQRYELYKYDLVFPEKPTSDTVTKPEEFPVLVMTTNDVPHTFASGYETALDISERTNVPLSSLLAYNEQLVGGYVLPAGEKIYLQQKKRRYSGPVDYHKVKTGESMYDIAQKYGVQYDRLLSRNRLEPGEQPRAGQMIKLKGWRVKTRPSVRSKPDEGFDVDDIGPVTPLPPTTTPKPNPPEQVEPTKPENPKPETKPAPTPAIVYHTVVQDDTLWNIARRYETSVEQLKRLNQLTNDNIRRGMQLRVK